MAVQHGDLIDIFVVEESGSAWLSDHGEALRHLDALGLDATNTPKKRLFLQDALSNLAIRVDAGRLVVLVDLSEPRDVATKLMRLGQAMTRGGDLLFTATRGGSECRLHRTVSTHGLLRTRRRAGTIRAVRLSSLCAVVVLLAACGRREPGTDRHGRTPLMVAAEQGQLAEVRRLLPSSDVNAQVKPDRSARIPGWYAPERQPGWTALHFARTVAPRGRRAGRARAVARSESERCPIAAAVGVDDDRRGDREGEHVAALERCRQRYVRPARQLRARPGAATQRAMATPPPARSLALPASSRNALR